MKTEVLSRVLWEEKMLPEDALLPLLALVALLLSTTLCVLAASGHFPREHRSPALQSDVGALVLFGSLAISLLSLAVGLVLAWPIVPWYAGVIGGGGSLLAAPLILRHFSDRFVNGRTALAVLAGSSIIAVGFLTLL